jgi:hypothetical protein
MHNLFSLNHSLVKTSTINNGWMRVLNSKTINDNVSIYFSGWKCRHWQEEAGLTCYRPDIWPRTYVAMLEGITLSAYSGTHPMAPTQSLIHFSQSFGNIHRHESWMSLSSDHFNSFYLWKMLCYLNNNFQIKIRQQFTYLYHFLFFLILFARFRNCA